MAKAAKSLKREDRASQALERDEGGTRQVNGNAGKKEVQPLRFPDGRPEGKKVEMKRVSFYIPAPIYEDVQDFAAERGDSMTGVFRWSLGVAKAIWDEVDQNRSVRVYSQEGKLLKELVFNTY